MTNLIRHITRWTALAGGIVLIAMIAMTCLSILGRAGQKLAAFLDFSVLADRLGPIRGDYELIEMGCVIAIFAFLPWCHLTQGHARVNLFGAARAGRITRWVDRFWQIVLAAVMLLILAQLWAGTQTKLASGETSFLRQIPIWWAYLASVFGAAIGAVAALWVAFGRKTVAYSDLDLSEI